MRDFTVIRPFCGDDAKTERLKYILKKSLQQYEYDMIETSAGFDNADLRGKRLLFAVPVGISGINLEYCGILKKIRVDKNCLEGCVGGVIIDGESEFYTKAAARDLTLSANSAGCAFVGKSLVEGTGTLKNYNTIAKNLSADNLSAYAASAENLVKNILDFELPRKSEPRILMVHAGNNEKSNTRMFWEMVKSQLGDIAIEEISLYGEEIHDCKGCPYVTCLHFGEQSSCFYGGVVTERVYPAILTCDVLVIVSPNYNDAAGAYITAFINRLTPLLRVNQLSGKQLFAVIVSGYSGGDLIAEQLIGAFNMNKPFILPPRFALFETANDAGEIKKMPEAERQAGEFARNMLKQIKK